LEELESLAAKLEENTPPAVSETSSAKQYLDNLLQSKASFAPPPPMPAKAAPAPMVAPLPMPSAAGGAAPGSFKKESVAPQGESDEGEEWRRVKIAPEVELHYRPGNQENQHRIASLLELARKIFNTK
jgi:hypothetical protein